MFKYIIKRLLLMIPTFMAATFIVFLIINLVPGGPFERAVMQIKAAKMGGGGEGGGGSNTSKGSGSESLSAERLEQLKKQFGLDKPVLLRYIIWLGLYPREVKDKTLSIDEPFRDNVKYVRGTNGKTYELQRWVKIINQDGKLQVVKSGIGSDFQFSDKYPELPNADQVGQWMSCKDFKIEPQANGKYRLVQSKFSGIFTGDLGRSYNYDKPVSTLIAERLHISSFFGIIGFLLTYLISIPLGIKKAIKHNTTYDFVTSAGIFIGYAIPGFALGSLLLVLFGGGSFWNIFPLGGFHSASAIWDGLSFLGKVKDLAWHTVLPVISYMIGSYATLTILMKNSLMENLNQDYVRTAFAKGLPENVVIYKHALRNSLIPIATGIGGAIGIFLGGSYLIERVFNIDGIGLLSYKSLVSVDYPVFLGLLVINIVVLLVGNLLSDLIYVSIDPRIKFD